MAQNRKITISGLNIVTHPHSPQKYVDLFRSAYRMKKSVALRTTQRLMIGELRRLDSDKEMIEGIYGRIYRFDQIDPNAPWFNVETNEVATQDEIAAITIPDELKPNLAMSDYVFYPRTHKLYYVSYHTGVVLSPGSLLKLFDNLFSTPTITKEFGKVEITIIPDRTQLSKILALHRLAKLTIDVVRPNPDDNHDDEEEVFRRFDRLNVRRIFQVYTAESMESIKPDHDTTLLAKVAADNGKVTAIGYTASGQRVEESTSYAPWKESITYSPDEQNSPDVLVGYTSAL
ncbi:DUF4747 family protein [Nitrosovibrio tenuis]|uniref:DUF4747 family protein n=1 Tax=Nitrosovibrio tenuis TaxID=1233 RepID=A0A1H7P8P9_9PROT|nr:DUF4747 family protein [Nitrosovibrio tenuis]SEL32151.1 protein of unknown function [Nitrosovibrio tenuis]